MYITEAMIASMEDMQKNASEMEKHIKGMMEIEARSHGLELDSRHNARDMWAQLSEHMASMPITTIFRACLHRWSELSSKAATSSSSSGGASSSGGGRV